MFLVVRKNDVLKFVIVAIVAIFLFVAMGASSVTVFQNASTKKVPVYSVYMEEKVVALTFDAAWGADKTRDIITIMQNYDAIGTFFLVGFWIDKYEEETKFIDSSGFEIGNHSNNHLNMSKLSADEINKEIASVNERLNKLTNKTPRFFRPPFGDYNNRVIEVVEKLDMIAIQWSVDSLDWKGISADEIANMVLSRVKNGSIVLFHNNSDNIICALKIILPKLKADGYKMVTIGNLVATSEYYIDSQGVQHKNA